MRIEENESKKFSNGFTGAEIPLVWTQDDNVFKPNKVYTEKMRFFLSIPWKI